MSANSISSLQSKLKIMNPKFVIDSIRPWKVRLYSVNLQLPTGGEQTLSARLRKSELVAFIDGMETAILYNREIQL